MTKLTAIDKAAAGGLLICKSNLKTLKSCLYLRCGRKLQSLDYKSTGTLEPQHIRSSFSAKDASATMCQYYMTRYRCGHRHRLLELEPECYLVDAQGNCHGCCERQEYAKYAKRDVPSPFDCPGCWSHQNGRIGPQNGLVATAAKNLDQRAVRKTKKKTKEAMEEVVDCGIMWPRPSTGGKPLARNLEGNWRVRKELSNEMTSLITIGTTILDKDTATSASTPVETEPETRASLAYGTVKILKRNERMAFAAG
ncbi:hypothetical protein FKW77_010224 [Venturia effusa]|uniref:Uncharacterized protein n=1 Tax=Venturia effusa TaxID=50376 RepID=A0A517L299_9PEZI|nr:hypothetical protein FKW77_010224 [Venturia effusa]